MEGPQTFTTAEAPAGQLGQIRRLLDEAFAGAFSDDDWEHTLGGWHVTVMGSHTPLAHAAVVARNVEVDGEAFRTGYVEGVATRPDMQGQGLGSVVMAEAMQIIRSEFELGMLSTERHSFYERLGWERWRGPTFVRRGQELVRSEDEDDGVMALRFGRSLQVNPHGPVSCEARSGDDW